MINIFPFNDFNFNSSTIKIITFKLYLLSHEYFEGIPFLLRHSNVLAQTSGDKNHLFDLSFYLFDIKIIFTLLFWKSELHYLFLSIFFEERF